MSLQKLMVACWLMCFGSLPLWADIVTNGSFESPVVTTGGFQNFTGGSTGITGWTVVGSEASVVSGTFSQDGITFPAEDGNQWLDLTGDGTNSDSQGVQQAFATTSGTQYTVSFWIGNVYNPAGIFGTTSTVDVLLGGVTGTSLGAFTNSSITPGTQVWQEFSTSFTATGSSTTLDFLNGDPGNDNSNGLDNVVITRSGTSPVPEPGWVSGLGLALIVGLGLFRRRPAVR
jgi:hypothetical protein